MELSDKFSGLEIEELFAELDINPQTGLDTTSLSQRRQLYGANILLTKPPISLSEIFIRQLKSVIVLLLVIAGISSFIMGQNLEGFSVVLVLLINTGIGFFTELKAIRSMEALKLMGVTSTTVLRDGRVSKINAEDLVYGDIVLFDAGDIITADMRIIEASHVEADESVLTGESMPVSKMIDRIENKTILAERKNILFKGTSITSGSGRGAVFATGMKTEVGKIVETTQQESEETTPLERRLDKLGQQLIWASLLIAVIVALSGIFSGKDLKLMVETAIALAVATIPEGLPIVATLALAKGMWAMAKKNALINKLAAVETLGATSIIFTDKTGTLTENKMTVRQYQTASGEFDLIHENLMNEDLKKCMEVGVLCNNASLDKDKPIGDPMEVALINIARENKLDPEKIKNENPELREVAFEAGTLMMATFHQNSGLIWVAVKGAPEEIINHCDFELIEGSQVSLTEQSIKKWHERNRTMAEDGLRVLGLATKTVSDLEEDPYLGLLLLGLVGLIDPARKDIKASINSCFRAGITTIMVTGDQEGTARKIAHDIGLIQNLQASTIHGKDLPPVEDWDPPLQEKILNTRIFSRVSPQQKFSLVKFFQSKNQVVAMTGDGVNDAPALKKADIGIAMGKRGTPVAKEAADMVLQDDQFETIVSAIKQGRIIYTNIQRFVVYLLSCNISEILVISLAAMANAPLPLTPLQILFLNLVTDVFPALALGMGNGDDTYLNMAPRKRNEDIISARKWGVIVIYGLILTACVLGSFYYVLQTTGEHQKALTVSFLTLGMSQLFHVFNMRQSRALFFNNDITRNPHVWAATLFCIILLILTVKIPFLRSILSLVELDLFHWQLVLVASLKPVFIVFIAIKLGFKADN